MEFVGERGFGKLISPFSEVIEKKGWGFFCEHKVSGFSALAREFYANMVGMKEDSVYVRGVWVPFGHRRINEMFKLRDPKHGSKYKKMVENPNYENILNLLTIGEGKWEATKKNPHHAIKRGALTEEENFMMSPLSHSYPEVQEHLPSQAEGSRSREDNIEIMEMLRSMKREMEEREQKWERQQQIIEDFLEVASRKKEQMWEQNWKLR